jgi:hypothetical protein
MPGFVPLIVRIISESPGEAVSGPPSSWYPPFAAVVITGCRGTLRLFLLGMILVAMLLPPLVGLLLLLGSFSIDSHMAIAYVVVWTQDARDSGLKHRVFQNLIQLALLKHDCVVEFPNYIRRSSIHEEHLIR